MVRMRSRAMLVLLACSLFTRRANAITPDDCARWIEELGGEVGRADIRGAEANESRSAIMQDIAVARRSVDESKNTSLERVKRVERQAADLVAHGRVSRVQGERLTTLTEATRRCLEHANAP